MVVVVVAVVIVVVVAVDAQIAGSSLSMIRKAISPVPPATLEAQWHVTGSTADTLLACRNHFGDANVLHEIILPEPVHPPTHEIVHQIVLIRYAGKNIMHLANDQSEQ